MVVYLNARQEKIIKALTHYGPMTRREIGFLIYGAGKMNGYETLNDPLEGIYKIMDRLARYGLVTRIQFTDSWELRNQPRRKQMAVNIEVRAIEAPVTVVFEDGQIKEIAAGTQDNFQLPDETFCTIAEGAIEEDRKGFVERMTNAVQAMANKIRADIAEDTGSGVVTPAKK